MLRSYLIAAWRNLAHNRLYAGINIAGLAIGLAAAILIGLYLRDEFSYDHWIPGYRQVYRVALQLQFGNLQSPPSAGNAPPVAGWLKQDFPEIAAAGRMQRDERVLRHGQTGANEMVYWADPELFDVLPLPAISGDPRSALESPDAVVLTERTARKYFGRTDPIGQTLDVDGASATSGRLPAGAVTGRIPFRVAAVLRDLPPQTHLNADIFLSARSPISPLPPIDAPLRLNMAFASLASAFTYIRLDPGADSAALARALRPFMLRHVHVPMRPDGKPLFPLPTMQLQPLWKLHFIADGFYSMKVSSSLESDYALALVGALIVLIAAFNFVNLTTARSARRAVEVGVRKIAGAGTRELMLQFLGESMLIVAAAALLAMAAVELAIPRFDAFLQRDIAFAWWREPAVMGALVVTVAVLGILGGLYPALVLSRLRPSTVLRGGPVPLDGRAAVREGLVALQFAALIGLLLTTAVVYRQMRFATADSLRFDTDQVLAINTDCRGAFPDEVRALAGVRAAACSNALFGADVSGAGRQAVIPGIHGAAASYTVSVVSVGPGLLRLFGLKAVAGRFFSADYPGDVAQPSGYFGSGGTVVINETAVRRLGFGSAQAAIGHLVKLPGQNAAAIIGVAPDFELQGVRHEIPPAFFRLLPQYLYLMVKLRGRDAPETLAQIDRLWGRLGDGKPISRMFLGTQIQLLYLDVIREAQVLAGFAAVAVFVASLGLLGLSAFTAERRTKEIGIRKSMGASTGQIVRLLLWQFGRPVLLANLLAWPVAGYLMGRWLQGFFYHVHLSWWLFAGSGAVALAVALATASTHLLLVARAHPVTALRYE